MNLFGLKKKKDENFELNLINYFNSKNIYPNPVQLLLPEAVGLLNINENWKSILSNCSRKERVHKTIELWKESTSQFSKIIDVFKSKLISIDTILYNKELYVVYSLKAYDGLIYYLGKLPRESYENSIMNKLPKEIQDFYLHIHDGFILFPDECMGPVSSDKFYCLGDDLLQSEFLDDYSVKDTYMIFSNGGGDGIVYDLSQNPPKGFTYFHGNYEDCDFENNPIDVMCEWMKIGLNGE
ncbi:SMI1/KNR4 family protein [Longibaculum muris]|uniref:SMI1/KNR4 family protein n=1 Tax=Longibaculum muris TaxID=1796628 RepID=UPI0012B79DC3|nr:SMI1/KNR4 family protein [Longibaculum muris]